MMSFGILTMQDRPWRELVDEWRWLEELGFDSAWTADHFVNPIDAESDWFEGWTLLAALATQTTSMRIGTLVSSMTLRNPALLARQALTVDHISGGRLELGLGAGRVPNDHLMTGVPEWSLGERSARFREFVELIRRLLHDRVTTFEGTHYRAEGAIMAPPAVQRPAPPIVVGALGPKMLRVAAEFGDVWNTIGGRHVSSGEALAETKRRVETFDQLCTELGRAPSSVRRSFLAFSPYVPDDPWQSPEFFVEYVESYRALGFEEIIFDVPPPARRRDVERVAADAMPVLRAR